MRDRPYTATAPMAAIANAHFVTVRKALPERDNGNVHRAAAKDLQAEKPARPAAPCATYCYHAFYCSAAGRIR